MNSATMDSANGTDELAIIGRRRPQRLFRRSEIEPANGSLTASNAIATASAVAGTDYASVSGYFTWNDGESHDQTFVVDILDPDIVVLADRYFQITLSNMTGGATAASPNPTIVIVTDDDLPGEISLVSATLQSP